MSELQLKRAPSWEISDSDPEDQPGTGTAEPGTDTTEPEDEPGTDTTEPEDEPGTSTTEPEYQPGTGYTEPEYQHGTGYTEPEYRPRTGYTEPEYRPRTGYTEPEYQPGIGYTEPEYQPGIAELQEQPGTSTTGPEEWPSTAWVQETQSTPRTPWSQSTPRWEEPAPVPAPVPTPRGVRRCAVGGRERLKEEQRMRKEEAERIKKLQPEEYLKTVTVNIHPALLQDSGCEVLLSTLTFLEWRNRIEEHDLTHSISWSRSLPDEDSGVLEEDQILMVVTQMDFMDMMISIRQALIGQTEEAESLFHPLSAYLNRNTGAVVSLLVTGGQLCREVSSEADDGDDEDEVCPRSQFGLQHTDIEEVLVYLQLYKNVTVHFLVDWQEVTNHMCAVTNALSKRPIRTLRQTSDLGFCVTGSWAAGVRVDRSGRGLSRVWTRQIHQLHRVSAAMAAAVTNAYPSPRLLMKAYKKVVTEDKQRFLLADLTARGGTKERRLGPQLSNRVHRLMTSQNPGQILDEGFV
ncbi:essential meiotic structure-specific endonuclease subunit 2 [Clarias gariepinus]